MIDIENNKHKHQVIVCVTCPMLHKEIEDLFQRYYTRFKKKLVCSRVCTLLTKTVGSGTRLRLRGLKARCYLQTCAQHDKGEGD